MDISRNCTRILSDARAIASASVTAPVFYGNFAKIQWRPTLRYPTARASKAHRPTKLNLPNLETYNVRAAAPGRCGARGAAAPRGSGRPPPRARRGGPGCCARSARRCCGRRARPGTGALRHCISGTRFIGRHCILGTRFLVHHCILGTRFLVHHCI